MIALWLLACTPDPTPPALLPTGWFDDTGDYAGDRCRHHVLSTLPAPDEAAWYHRDPLLVRTNTRDSDRYTASLHNTAGDTIPSRTIWNGLAFQVVPEQPLAPDTDHLLRVLDCEQQRVVPFRTSAFGLALHQGASSLLDRTYDLDFAGADWVAPDGIGPLLSLYFVAPVFVAVRAADDTQLQLSLSVGINTNDGTSTQDPNEPVFPFPPTSFVDQPYFAADVGRVPLPVAGAEIPVAPFAFSGTFSADGTAIAGGTLHGTADTRGAGVLLGDDRPQAVCEFGAGLGVVCQPCSDGEPYCLDIEVRNIQGAHVPGMVLQEN